MVSGSSPATMGYVLGALALAESLAISDPHRRRLCMVTSTIHPDALAVLINNGMWELIQIEDIQTPPTTTKTNHNNEINTLLTTRKSSTFTKLRILDPNTLILPTLDMFLFIDADAYVRLSNTKTKLKQLFEPFDQNNSAAIASMYPISAAQNIPFPRCITTKEGKEKCFSKEYEFNTGVLRIIPSEKLTSLQIFDILFHDANGPDTSQQLQGWNTWDTDQAILNDVLNYTLVTTLSSELNSLMCCSFYDTRLKTVAEKAVVVHFSVSAPFKPWEMMRYEAMIKMGMKTIEDYTFVPWFLENSIFFDVYIEWRNFATQGMKRLDGLNKRKMELYMMREKDFLNV